MNEHDTSSSAGERGGSSTTAAATSSEPSGQPPAARLLRFPDEGPGAGIAAGLGAYFGLDPVFFRIAFLLLVFAGGTGVILYGVAWLVIPAAAPGQTTGHETRAASDRTAQWVGIGLIVAAAFWLAGPFNVGGPVLWALALVAVGVVLFREDANRRSREASAVASSQAGSPAARPPTGVPSGGSPVSGSRVEEEPDRPSPSEESSPDAPEDAEIDEGEAVLQEAARLREGELQGWSAGGWESAADGGGHGAAWVPAPPPPAAPEPRRRRSFLGRATIGVALVAIGIVALADNLAPGVAVTPARYLALGLTIVGAGLLVGAWRGRARGLIPLGLLLLPLLAATTLFPAGAPWHGGVGERMWHPDDVTEVSPDYRLGAGQLSLDLSDVDFTDGDRTVSASVGLGQLDVVVPDDVDVAVTASTRAGELDLFGETISGSRLEEHVSLSPSGDGPPSASGDGSLTLDLESGLGQITVSRAAD